LSPRDLGQDGRVTTDRLRAWMPEGGIGLAVLLAGFLESVSDVPSPFPLFPAMGVIVGVAAAVALSRRQPGAALAILWLTALYQLATGTPVLTVEIAVAVVAFGCARWGRPATVVLSGLSIPAAAGIGALLVTRGSYGYFRDIVLLRELVNSAYRFSDTLLVGAVVLGLLTSAVPWLAGLLLRATARAQQSEVRQEQAEADTARALRETEQAREIAELRDQQARMARDVHDVVGHSLAVILAQAESAQYLADDPAALKHTMATIATSARSSLQDVRRVLTGPRSALPTPTLALEELLEGVRRSGTDVVATESGEPRPLPPELDIVAHRVAQEMLTNAMKHGRRDRPVTLERHWPEGAWDRDLRIEVRNAMLLPDEDPEPDAAPGRPTPVEDEPPGQGLDGMRRRLESVGGRLDVRRRDEPDGPTFTVTAWVPVSAR
jgi:signal transduction histidine kinase